MRGERRRSMEGRSSPRQWLRWAVLALIGLALLFLGVYCGDVGDQVRRVDARVWAGVRAPDGYPSELEDDEWHPLLVSNAIRTDEGGQAEVTLVECVGSFWVFGDSDLGVYTCERELKESANFLCLEFGDAGFDEYCEGRLAPGTPSATLEVSGTAFTLSYLPEYELSLVTVITGTVWVTPVLDVKTHELADEAIVVRGGEFVYTLPGTDPEPIADLDVRVALPLDKLPAMVEKLDLQPRFDLITLWGQEQKILTPAWPIKLDVGLWGQGGPLEKAGIEEALLAAIDFKEVAAAGLPRGEINFTVTNVDGETVDAYSLTYDPEKSKELLYDGGYKDGFAAAVVYPAGDTMLEAMAERMAGYLQGVGLDAKAHAVQADQMDFYVKKVQAPDVVAFWLLRQ
jgi:hypothetical protein